MSLALLLSVLLFQAAPASKPVIDNDRVAVWDLSGAVGARPGDALVISLEGHGAAFVPKGRTPKASGRNVVVDLKDHPEPRAVNKTAFPLAFPRPGSKKLIENARVIVWDYSWTPGQPTPMHFHDKDALVVYLEDGDLKSTSPLGESVVNSYHFGTIRFNARDRSHTELLVRGKQHAIITELK